MREITLHVEPSKHAPRLSRHHLKEMRQVLEPRFDDVAVVVSELVTNSVRYADADHGIDVVVAALEDRIRVEVSDAGPCFDKDTPRGEGMGLHIVDRIAESWGIKSESRCTVWVEIPRS